MTKALRGINIGGWLVAERWMTPSLFDGVEGDGEIALVKELGKSEAVKRLRLHRDEFITEADFVWIKKHGFDFVRLPVGYWLFEETDDFIDGEGYVEKAFAWATAHNLGIVLDFHGLQGSQNGYDHSGQTGKVRLYRPANRSAALRTLAYMCEQYGQEKALLAVEVINEPKVRFFMWRLMDYYHKAYSVADKRLGSQVKIIVSDAFKPLKVAKKLSRRRYGKRLVLDIHLYQVFSREDQQLTIDGHVEKVQQAWDNLLKRLAEYLPVMVGEWSAALPLAVYSNLEASELELASRYFTAQQELFDSRTWAHSYWTYKAPGCGVWDYRSQTSFHS